MLGERKCVLKKVE